MILMDTNTNQKEKTQIGISDIRIISILVLFL